MKFTTPRVILALPLSVRCATTVTLYGIYPSSPQTDIPHLSQTYSIVGIGSDGLTKIGLETHYARFLSRGGSQLSLRAQASPADTRDFNSNNPT
ncbi:hypothetical protein BDZ94DRAFT_1313221 [Collybia nuda]|uniref:Uncharacterized protein n=1 Tax=Collybia nuda TaxID=64659 RepID=A0A9P5XVL0_9AGAR|nr:hypothetical protein BDZ94DRAFT_1313221 [Collybia nuda]